MLVIDDLDMINEQSQQVFRNYIDKYKNNVNFIAVCTNIQKVIESIQSRVHILQLESPNVTQFHKLLEKITENEQMILSEEIKTYLLQISNNSIRNLITYLEKIYVYSNNSITSTTEINTNITLEECTKLCTVISFQYFENYIKNIKNKELANAIFILYSIHDYGYSVIDILDYFFSFIKSTQIVTEDEKYNIIPIICKYITIFHNVHEDCIELSLFTNAIYKVLL